MLVGKLAFVELILTLVITTGPVRAQTPQIQAGGVVNAASYSSVLAPGVIFSIFGVNLTGGTQGAAASTPLPTQLAGARVLVNGVAAPLSYASSLQINAQFPVELAGLDNALIQVEVDRTSQKLTSEAVSVAVGPVSPGIFTYDQSGSGPGAILRNRDFSLICPAGRTDCPTNRAQRGEAIAIYLTGVGQVQGPWASGETSEEPSPTLATPVVAIGGIETPVLFSGLATGFVGLYQVNVAVPADAPFGEEVPLSLTLGGISQQVTIAIGPESSGGVFTKSEIGSLAVNPSNPSTVLAATLGDGMFGSTDQGLTWNRVTLSTTDTYIRQVVFDSANPGTVYTATDGGVLKSTDAGMTWAAPSFDESYLTFIVAVDPLNPPVLYAGTNFGPFKSTDGGATWSAINSGITDRYVMALAVDPADSGTVYMGTTPGGSAGHIFKSTDGGATWNLLALEPPDTRLSALAIDPLSPATIYAGTSNGVYKSLDGGQSWNSVSSPPIWSITIDPSAPDTVYATTSGLGIFKSVDGGLNWVESDAGIPEGQDRAVPTLVIDPTNPGTLYAGTITGEVFLSTDGAASWHPVGTN